MSEKIRDRKLNKAQKEAVTYSDWPLLIVAGAGTGKTTVITDKIAYLINEKKAEPHEILALTFTEKAAQEMQERVDLLVENPYLNIQISTFHAFCQQLLEQYGLDIGIPRAFKLFTDVEAWLLLREHIYDLELDYYRPLGNPSKYIHDFLNHFSKCKDELISASEYLAYAEDLALQKDTIPEEESSRITELAHAYHTYNQLLLDAGALDFGDLVFYAVKLLKERAQVAQRIQKTYKYILVDEFQDVNYAQYELVKHLSARAQLTVVGDDDQSIYAFRGASVSNILRFKDDYKQAKEIVLTENFRSGKEILDAAYTLIQNNNPDRLEAKLKLNKRLTAAEKLKAHVQFLNFPSVDKEVNGVIEKILELKEQDTKATWDDFAILVRANNHAQPFIETLDRRGVPYEFLSASGLYRQRIVLDAVHLLKMLRNVHDSLSLYRILQLPFLYFPEQDLHKVLSFAERKGISYYEILERREVQLTKEGREVADKLISIIKSLLARVPFEKPSIVLYAVLEEIGYLKHLANQDAKHNERAMLDVLHIGQFFDFIKKYEQAVHDATIHHFLEYHAALLESGDEGALYEPGNTPDSVNILTIHGAKGLEFKYVFMVNMVEDRFPTRRRGEGIPMPEPLIKEILPEGDVHYQEERRLCYVGMTRAKNGLWFTAADFYGEASRAKKYSRFLAEIGLATPENAKKPVKSLTEYAVAPSVQKKVQHTYQLPAKFSFSQLRSYETCPYKYKLAHILKLPPKGSASTSFGQTMHTTLQRFYERVRELNSAQQVSLFEIPAEKKRTSTEQKNGGADRIVVPPFSELMELYEKAWIRDWYKGKRQQEEFYKKGKDILKIFYESQQDNWTIPVALESFFKIKIGEECITGRIDRVDQLSDGSLEIIDYKTGKTREQLDSEDKEQLLIYQIAATRIPTYRNMGSTSTLSFYYLNDNLKVSFSGSQDDMQKLEEKLATLIARIRQADFRPTPGKFVCGYCDFKDICEFRIL